MAKSSLTEKSTEQLQSNLAAIRKIHLTTIIIFGVIIVVWIVGGYWRTSTPVFISTVAMALAIAAVQISSRSGIEAELKKRGAL